MFQPDFDGFGRILAGLREAFSHLLALCLVCIVLFRAFCAFWLGHRLAGKPATLLTRQNGAKSTKRHYAAPPKWEKMAENLPLHRQNGSKSRQNHAETPARDHAFSGTTVFRMYSSPLR